MTCVGGIFALIAAPALRVLPTCAATLALGGESRFKEIAVNTRIFECNLHELNRQLEHPLTRFEVFVIAWRRAHPGEIFSYWGQFDIDDALNYAEWARIGVINLGHRIVEYTADELRGLRLNTPFTDDEMEIIEWRRRNGGAPFYSRSQLYAERSRDRG